MVNLEVQPKSAEVNVLSQPGFYKVRAALVYKFANMGLSGKEISYAVEIETGIVVGRGKVKNLVHIARRRGIIRQLTPEEKKDIVKTINNKWDYTDMVMKNDVLSILQNIKRLQKESKPLPQNRLELAQFRLPHEDLRREDDGIKIGNKIVFEDGRYIPTFKGLRQTDKQKQMTSEKNRGPKSREQITRQSTVWSKVKPLHERMALSSEIAEITGFTREQVNGTIKRNRFRPEWSRSSVLTPEQIVILQERSGRARRPRNPKDRPLPTQDDKNSLVFAQKLLEEGLVTSDLSFWVSVNELYKDSGRKLPDNFSQKLRLEILLRGLREGKKGSSETLIKYDKLGREINAQWFEKNFLQEEGFVKAKAFTTWANGEDKEGFFGINGDGIKFRRGISEDSVYVYDNSAIRIKRILSRNFVRKVSSRDKSMDQLSFDSRRRFF